MFLSNGRGRLVLKLLITLFVFFCAVLANSQIVYLEQIDPFTDEDTSLVAIPYGDAALIWQCGSNDDSDGVPINLYLKADDYLGTASGIYADSLVGMNYLEGRYRFDKDEQQDLSFTSSTEGTEAFIIGYPVNWFTDEALNSSALVVGVLDYRGTEHVYTFNLSGLREELSKLSCVDIAEIMARATIKPTAANPNLNLQTVMETVESYGCVSQKQHDFESGSYASYAYSCEDLQDLRVIVDEEGIYLAGGGRNAALWKTIVDAIYQ